MPFYKNSHQEKEVKYLLSKKISELNLTNKDLEKILKILEEI